MALQKSGIFQMDKNNIDVFRKKIDKIELIPDNDLLSDRDDTKPQERDFFE